MNPSLQNATTRLEAALTPTAGMNPAQHAPLVRAALVSWVHQLTIIKTGLRKEVSESYAHMVLAGKTHMEDR
jgi:hypothetical protein